MPSYWQVAAGSNGRDYSDLFLRFGMAFVGGETQTVAMAQVEQGDILVLKSGLSRILAVGDVVDRDGAYKGNAADPADPTRERRAWLRDFDGWDLPAWCNVSWRRPEHPVGTSGLTRATIQRVHLDTLKGQADQVLRTGEVIAHQCDPEPVEDVSDDEIMEFLIREGLRPAAADELTATVRKVRLLAEYYYHNVWDVREHETRAFLVVPLLIALGWAEQRMKLELACSGGRVDIACFSRNWHRSDSNRDCVALVEAKSFPSGLDYAPEQARGYATHFPSCRVLVVTNGYCYKSYLRSASGEFSDVPSAYLNLLRPKRRYPLNPTQVEGALGVLQWLLPGSALERQESRA